jgi:6-pyruvoyltetrahydropterin/6-carboxytetrahydropterin synthase
MTTVFIEDSFDAAHWLPNVPDGHKCKRMHGHTYRVRIEMTGPVGAETGWVMDYETIQKAWRPAKNTLDHHTLNDILPNPTCELIAEWIGHSMGPWCSRVEVRETVNCGAVWAQVVVAK